MKTNLLISDKNILIKWDDKQLNEIILNMFSPWQSDGSFPNYEIIIKRFEQGYILTTPKTSKKYPNEKLLIYHLENELTLLSQKIFSEYLQLHGSCIDHNGNGALIVGSHGVGKTTLALTAISSGLKALTDDVAIFSEDLRYVICFPRPFKATDSTWNMYPKIVPEDCPYYKLSNDIIYVFIYIPSGSYYANKTRLKHIFFPIRKEGSTEIREMGETEALSKILPQGFNFYMKKDGRVNDLLNLLRIAPPLEIAFSDHWDAIKKICDVLE